MRPSAAVPRKDQRVGYSIRKIIADAEKEFVGKDAGDGLEEIRCPWPHPDKPNQKCNKLLGRHGGPGKTICPRCGRLVTWRKE
jgi:hypothetical protein